DECVVIVMAGTELGELARKILGRAPFRLLLWRSSCGTNVSCVGGRDGVPYEKYIFDLEDILMCRTDLETRKITVNVLDVVTTAELFDDPSKLRLDCSPLVQRQGTK